ncbi:methyltransferase [Beijerinckia sp. L45]|uniref:methyltransferase n=1 Tax=Beijerinckia sp. L45 TaxID=1641855 RepID=UPI001FED552F|nr:methyltransferase [Beijerinckia sp. L45]
MGQNTSHAVMAQRVEPHDSLEDFPTQPWATRALIEKVIVPAYARLVDDPMASLKTLSVWEPCCNRGHMAMPLAEYFGAVHASDIHDYGWAGQQATCDFLMPGTEPKSLGPDGPNWLIFNPPFRLAEQFIERSFQFPGWHGSAAIVRTSFLEGVGRYDRLFSKMPPDIIAQFTERVPMVKGRLTATGSTATAYCWLVWMAGKSDYRFVWIPPSRKQLERASDYPVSAAAASPAPFAPVGADPQFAEPIPAREAEVVTAHVPA